MMAPRGNRSLEGSGTKAGSIAERLSIFDEPNCNKENEDGDYGDHSS
jgi:hypothetical protein